MKKGALSRLLVRSTGYASGANVHAGYKPAMVLLGLKGEIHADKPDLIRKRQFASNSIRPFRILGLQQIAIGCADRSSLKNLWYDILGLTPDHTNITIDSENVVEDIVKIGVGVHATEIDLMTPIDAEKSPKVHIPPLNHIGLWVDNLEEAVQWMATKGVRFAPGGIRTGAAGHNVAFIHPKGSAASPLSGNGVLIELVQAPDIVVTAHSHSLTE